MNSSAYERMIKGKISELIFEEMFLSQGKFKIVHNGYEYTDPEIAQNLRNINKKYFYGLRHKPDFILFPWNSSKKFLVEIKYRYSLNGDEILQIAKELKNNYGLCYLFIATPEKFYFNACTEILEKEVISEMSENWIPSLIQKKFLKLLNKFIPE